VRGYRENSLVQDNGASASAELRIPFYQHHASNSELQFAPFVDWGRSWNNKRENLPSRGTQSIVGAGAGLRAVMGKLISAEIFWAHNFSNLDTTNETTIQDNGIHFQLSIGWPK
jgi:hemolysin activation/secretion protein